MSYTIITTKSIQKELDNLPYDLQQRVYGKISQLSENPRLDGVTKLKGYENEYRVRVGDYRIRYEISGSANFLITGDLHALALT